MRMQDVIKEGAAHTYHCKDCGCEMHNCKPDCKCEHDSHDESGSWWRDENGNGVPDIMESKDTHCSDKCCGADVKREDCTCAPTCKHCNCNDNSIPEGKSPHKKGTKKYKKHMAAMHAEGDYKEHIRNRLKEALAELEETANTCPECGNLKATDEQFDEAKQRLDPKCWKGKKIGNPKTKMKGGVRVNNCVPA
jgi:hypothetical protein